MSAPLGWDEKSWLDVVTTRERLQALVLALREAEGVDDPSADRIESLLLDVVEVAQVGAMAASWCKQ